MPALNGVPDTRQKYVSPDTPNGGDKADEADEVADQYRSIGKVQGASLRTVAFLRHLQYNGHYLRPWGREDIIA